MPVAQIERGLMRIIVHRRRPTDHLIELQTLFYSVTGEKAGNFNFQKIEYMSFTKITIQATILADLDKAWAYYTEPTHIIQWNFASDDWHCPRASNDLVVGGKFNSRMEAKFGDIGFDFEGTYTEVVPKERFTYKLADEREVSIQFIEKEECTQLVVIFDAETENPVELQQQGWQTILNQYKKYTEAN